MSRVYLLLFCAFIFETAIAHGASDKSVKPEITNHSKSYLEGLTAASLLCVDALMNINKNLLVQSNEYSNETEQSLKDQDYNEKLIKKLDYVNANLRLAQSLRDRLSDKSINSNTLHIQEFADQMDVHIAFIEEGIKSQSSTDKAERLELLERLKLEAQHRKNSEAVTYRYWFNFNLRLSILATPKEERYKPVNAEERYKPVNSDYNPQLEEGLDSLREWIVNDSELESYYKVFQGINDGINFNSQLNIGPGFDSQNQGEVSEAIYTIIDGGLRPDERNKIERFSYLTETKFRDTEQDLFRFVNLLHDFPRIIIIPTIHDDLGIMSINKAYGTGVVFVNLDRTQYSYRNFLMKLYLNVSVYIDNSQIRTHFQSMLGRLTKPQREMVELIYFYATATHLDEKSLEEFPITYDWMEEMDGEDILKSYGYGTNQMNEGNDLYIQLLITSWIKGRGVEETVVMVKKHLDEHPELKKDILERLDRI